jgi:hypothetical protein
MKNENADPSTSVASATSAQDDNLYDGSISCGKVDENLRERQ